MWKLKNDPDQGEFIEQKWLRTGRYLTGAKDREDQV